jgi:hypothetical protein
MVEMRKPIAFLVLNNRLELSLAQEVSFELATFADSSVFISLVSLCFLQLVCTMISPGNGHFDPPVKATTELWLFSA